MSRVTFFLFITLFFFSCSEERLLYVKVNNINAEHIPQLPAGFSLSSDGNEPPVLTVNLQTLIGPRNNLPFLFYCEPLIPRINNVYSPNNITFKNISDQTTELIPLSLWKDPGKAAFIDGIGIDDPAYPVWKSENLIPEWAADTDLETKMILLKWLGKFKTAETPQVNVTWIAAAGDMMLQRGVQDMLLSSYSGPSSVFNDLLPRLSSFDLLMANLEGAVTSGNGLVNKSYNFKFSPGNLPVLKQIGFDYFSLTNNHAYDYGQKGFIDTLNNFKAAGMPTSGVGMPIEEALRPAIFSINNTEYRILSVGAYPSEQNGFDGLKQASVTENRPGILWFDQKVLDHIRTFSSKPGIDIIMVHGGHEWQRNTDTEQRKKYRSLIDAGADIVFGSHPHVIQGVESYKNGIIYYSLGNFVFNGMEDMPHAEDSMLAVLGIVGDKILYRRDIGVVIDKKVLKIDKSGRIMKELSALSEHIPPEL